MAYLIPTAISPLSPPEPCSAFPHNTGHAEGTEMTVRTPQIDKGMGPVGKGRLRLSMVYVLFILLWICFIFRTCKFRGNSTQITEFLQTSSPHLLVLSILGLKSVWHVCYNQ